MISWSMKADKVTGKLKWGKTSSSSSGGLQGHKQQKGGEGGRVRQCFLVGIGRPSVLMLMRSAAGLATMRPVLLSRVLTHGGTCRNSSLKGSK